MKEKEFINIIKNTLNSDYIGDDCAYLRDLGIVVSQDSLVEDVHFKREFITPYQLGYKSVMVNVSDICASGAKPVYLTISLSLPNDIDSGFVKEFYEGAKSACEYTQSSSDFCHPALYKGNSHNEVRLVTLYPSAKPLGDAGSPKIGIEGVKIVGGDITSADKIYVSVCAIGDAKGRNISSRKNAKEGYKVVVSGLHGSSCAGLKLLMQGKSKPEKFIKAHLQPQAQVEFGQNTGLNIKSPYAMMDTSDGLMDALSAIANESGVLLEIDFDKIPHDKDLEQFNTWQDMVLFGGEDYGLVAVVPQDFDYGTQIGVAKKGLGVDLNINDKTIHYSKQDVEDKIFNHFSK